MKLVHLLLLMTLMTSGRAAAESPSASSSTEYAEAHRILRDRCVSCHGAVKQESNLRLDAGSLIVKGGEKSVVVPGRADESELLKRVTTADADRRMPPEGARLSSDAIAVLRKWINDGALYPADERVPRAPSEHWSFLPVQRLEVPTSTQRTTSLHPIDCFVATSRERNKETLPDVATAQQLMRRVYLDLIGLPPTIEEQEQFARDPDLERLIDRLLASPKYGERWGRHWLDVVRYADSNGYERDAEKPFVWRYRDYVIDSFNEDKPFDRFALEQIAGDELPHRDVSSVIATGFLRVGCWDDEPADPATDRFDQLDDIISTTSQAFLAMTIGCARCHDHKFEPLTTRDYYSLIAVFDSLERPRQGRTEETLDIDGLPIYAWRDALGQVKQTFVLLRGSPTNQGPSVSPALPAILAKEPFEFSPPTETFVGRRLTLARWIASRQNPLTARVIVNRVWQQHFGRGLVRTANDFGIMGSSPEYPELLDWLAAWFMDDAQWSLKKLHRLILTSCTWQAQKNEASLHDFRRLEVESIRDSILAVSGDLNGKRYGPGVRVPIQKAVLEANSDKEKIWPVAPADETHRRSIYTFIKRSLIVPMFESFDLADTVSSCPQRQVTTVAPQALTLFNSEFMAEQSKSLAARLRREAGDSARDQVRLGWRLTCCREPSKSELESAHAFITEESLEQFCRVLLNLNEFVYPE